MNPLVYIMVADVAVEICVAAICSYLHYCTPARYLRTWTIGWWVGAAAQILLLAHIALGTGPFLFGLAGLGAGAAIYLIAMGAYQLINQRLSAWWLAAAAVGLVVGGASTVVGGPPWVGIVTGTTFLAALTGWTGITFLRLSDTAGVGERLLGWGMLLFGVHVCDFPFVAASAVLEPWGYVATGILKMFLAMSILILHFEQARRALRESEERYRSIFEGSVEGIFRCSDDGFIDVSPALVRMLGYESKEDVISLRLPEDLFADMDGRERLLSTLEERDALDGHEVEWRRADGEGIAVVLRGRQVRDPEGRVIFYDGFAHDVTAAKRLQAQLIRAQKMEAIGRVAGGVAHDFNNLLTVIIGNVALVAEQVSGEGREYLANIGDSARRAGGLVTRLLAFARRQHLDPETLDLCAHVERMRSVLEPLAGERIQVDISVAEPLFVRVDPGQLEQVVLNLALNARDAMPDGGELRVRVSADQHGDSAWALLEVSDNGVGMSEATQQHLFEPFFTTKEAEAGTGLGLASVFGIVTQSGGRIDVDSSLGSGTVFRVLLPRVEPEPERPLDRVVVASSPAPTRKRRILVVEDESMLRDLFGKILRERGHDVLIARDGEEALAIARSFRLDLVVTDIVMPGMTGIGLAERLRARSPDLPVVFMTGYADELPEEFAIGRDECLLKKPFTSEQLVATVEAAFAGGSVGACVSPPAG